MLWLKKKQVYSLSWICLQNLPPPVLPVVILIIEGASFKNLKIARSENGIVNDGTLLEARWLGKALIMWCRLLLVAGRVAPRLMELLAGLVLKIQLYCLVTTFWVVFIGQPSPTNLRWGLTWFRDNFYILLTNSIHFHEISEYCVQMRGSQEFTDDE